MTDRSAIMFTMTNVFYIIMVSGIVLAFYIFLGSLFLVLMILCIPVCVAGEKVNKTETSTSDRQCEACPVGKFTGATNQQSCASWTNNIACSAGQKKQDGNYFDTFLKFNFDYDKRNQKFKTTDGFRSYYSIDLPLISDTNTLTNSYNYKVFNEFYENNITTFSISLSSANSISDDDIKLSERLYIPSRKLRGFEAGKVGPKDGSDYVGGNYISTINATSTIPYFLENIQNVDIVMFADVGNIWGVDYNSSLDTDEIRSSVGLGLDWLTPVGPLTFSLAHPITQAESDITETFRFNLGTTF